MSLATAIYYYLTCNGRLNNQVQPKCPALSDGVLGSEEEVREKAVAAGWLLGTKDYCPSCARNHIPAPDSPVEAPKRSRRQPKATDPEPFTNHEPQEQFA